MNEKEVNESFFNIVVSLAQAAMMSMGKLSNPQTGKVEKNMNIAKINIDILQMLKDKTVGNLSAKENEILSDSLTTLQLTYADEVKKGDTEEEGTGEEASVPPQEEEKTEEKPETAETKKDSSE